MIPKPRQAVSLRAYNSLGLDALAEYLLPVHSVTEARSALALAKQQSWPVTMLGGGSNVVLTGNVSGLVIVNRLEGITFEGARVVAAAGEVWQTLVDRTLAQGLTGLENLSLIPGSVGGAPIQNIGAYGVELAQFVETVNTIDCESLEDVSFDRAACQFGYRDSFFKRQGKGRYLITSVELRLEETFSPRLDYAELRHALADNKNPDPFEVSRTVCEIRRRKLPDPAVIGNVGSFFKNPVVAEAHLSKIQTQFPDLPYWPEPDGQFKLAAGWLIDQCGLRDSRVGDAGIYEHHALVIVNLGDATPRDVTTLAENVVAVVSDRFDILLETEPVLMGG